MTHRIRRISRSAVSPSFYLVMDDSTQRRVPWLILFAALAAIWGSSFLLIKIADRSLDAVDVSFLRVLSGALALVVLAALRSELPRFSRTQWFHLAVTAALFNSIPFTLFAWGETRTSSVLAGIWNAATPLFALPCAMLLVRDEPVGRGRVMSVLVGFAGVLIVFGPWRGSGGAAVLGNLACVAAAACYGLAFAYVRRYLGSAHAPVALATGQLICAAVEMAVVALAVGASRGVPNAPSAASLAAVVALGVVGTALAYVFNYTIIRSAGITVASTVTYVVPLFSTVLGVALLGERLHWNVPLGGLVILGAAAAAQGRLRLRRRQPAASSA
jgi:drug/metabolite transporter (DMT)-like permease